MRNLLVVLFALQAVFAFGQKASNNLIGTFKNKSFWILTNTLEFDGKGKVNVNGKAKHEFFERNDTIFILQDNNPMYLIKQGKNQLKGFSKNIKRSTFNSTSDSFEYGKMSKEMNKMRKQKN
ncbi:hypothetical protein [Myroides pelagicus]|uniref:DUF4369 domain-containing protein n=1 Tax=Myroides pelagicus TaxID=270914 RepID=A0A7K1GHG5_9FLAO|nr:hypothetical protein [Myroides pelagicus]MTH28445.1 hypothetical protein [Myroides pelagicus]